MNSWRRGHALALLGALFTAPLAAHDPATTRLTWSGEISRIFLKRCAGCHQTGGRAPMPLTNYREARPWAVAIKEEVLRRGMPPWPAAKGFGSFSNDLSLPQEEINRIAEWAEGGAPEGNPALLPARISAPRWTPPAAPAGRKVKLGGVLKTPVELLAILGVPMGKTWAALPGGGVEPLVWGLTPKPAVPQPLLYRQPVRLPAGTSLNQPIEALISSAALR